MIGTVPSTSLEDDAHRMDHSSDFTLALRATAHRGVKEALTEFEAITTTGTLVLIRRQIASSLSLPYCIGI